MTDYTHLLGASVGTLAGINDLEVGIDNTNQILRSRSRKSVTFLPPTGWLSWAGAWNYYCSLQYLLIIWLLKNNAAAFISLANFLIQPFKDLVYYKVGEILHKQCTSAFTLVIVSLWNPVAWFYSSIREEDLNSNRKLKKEILNKIAEMKFSNDLIRTYA